MLIKVNGEEMEVKDGSTIEEVIELANAPYSPGSILCLIRGKEELEKNISKYKIKTNKGSIIIELTDEEAAAPLVELWKENYSLFDDLNIRWSTPSEVAIGPIVTDLEPTPDEYKYYEGDVVLSLSSFSNESTHLILIKENVSNVYSVPPFNKGIFARVIGGKKTLDLLTERDGVINVEPIIERSVTTNTLSVSDLDIVLEEGNELYTYVSLDIDENSPVCAEHLFSLISGGKVKVSFDSNSFLGFYELQGIDKPKEDLTPRRKGTVTVRNEGIGVGRVYVYRENRVLAPSHTTVGHITNGMEIIDIAKENDFITVISEQQRIMTLNTTQAEANKLLDSLGIKQIRDGVTDDDALIVSQTPHFTLDILKEGKVFTKGINKDELCTIELTDKAPRSKWYLEKLTGLAENPIGSLKVHFAVPGMKIVIFQGDAANAKGLIPENVPKDIVKAGEIGITNMAAKNVGLIGVRFEDNSEFGPTAESFAATNIVGKVCSDFEILEKLKDGDVLYVTQFMPEA
ncbi:MAG: methanogenesis marker 3 protein [Methanobrevibacter sp.]|uniref:methyl-coenzyme M reductase-associated protein Mmp3 n=1 Tax=Methanobrevibacter sp. TaxID=66852 RepID=UPI0026DF8A4C|nr:methanogenesis marker 3 protein [Methanobrevibacter sp.]MDO5848854.1 methanogenesis marker 3 protein [Methanobrevibacter sp.]